MRGMAGLAPSQIHLLHSSTLMAQAAPTIKLHWCLVLDDKVRLIVELCRASAICLWRLTSVMKRKVCWFDDAEELIEGRRKVRTCQDCRTNNEKTNSCLLDVLRASLACRMFEAVLLQHHSGSAFIVSQLMLYS